MRDQLHQVDALLNSAYTDLRSRLKDSETAELTSTQRKWIRTRDQSCGLDQHPRSRDAWLAHVAASENRTRCVIDATQKRLEELQRLQRQASGVFVVAEASPPIEKPGHLAGEASPARELAPEMRTRSSRTHRTGKHYFEIVIDETHAGDMVASVVAQIIDGSQSHGVSHEVKSRDLVLKLGESNSVRIVGGRLGDLRIPKIVIGWAVDLDAGRIYRHRDGTWLDDAPPGSRRGIVISRNSDVFAEVTATVPVAALRSKGILEVNFGAAPFTGSHPAGYRGFDWPDHLTNGLPDTEVPAGVPSKGRIAGTTQVQWLQRYTEWIRSFPPSESPTADSTGERCGAGQSGDVWFLTGARDMGKVQRECVVPEGKFVLVPVIHTVAQAPSEVPCERLQVALRKFVDSASELRFSLDDKPWRGSDIRQLGAGCFKLRDGATGQSTTAAVQGHWVFLPPLSKGPHVIQFGGRFTADGFEQDVTYILHVR